MISKKLAVIFPGVGYNKDKPLLYYAAKLALSKGYDIYSVDFHDMPSNIRGDEAKTAEAARLAYEQADARLSWVNFSDYDEVVFIGKSIGTAVAAKYATDRGMDVAQVWYTPVEKTFSFGTKRAIAFIGDNDPWSVFPNVEKLAAEAGVPLHVYSGCNHSLETADIEQNIANLQDVMHKTAEFIL